MRVTRTRMIATAVSILLPIGALANDSCNRLIKELGKQDCSRLGAQMTSFLQQNKGVVSSLPKLAAKDRKLELQAYRSAFEKAETVAEKCDAKQVKEIDAKLKTTGTDPQHISGLYSRLNATLDFALQTDSTDPYVYEQLGKSYEELLNAYSPAKAGKPAI